MHPHRTSLPSAHAHTARFPSFGMGTAGREGRAAVADDFVKRLNRAQSNIMDQQEALKLVLQAYLRVYTAYDQYMADLAKVLKLGSDEKMKDKLSELATVATKKFDKRFSQCALEANKQEAAMIKLARANKDLFASELKKKDSKELEAVVGDKWLKACRDGAMRLFDSKLDLFGDYTPKGSLFDDTYKALASGKPVEQGMIFQYATIGSQMVSILKSDPSAAYKKADKRFVDAIQVLGKLKKAKK